ncbi:YslB family protein [Fructobacillus americanaquae]|uniref:YslB family protein n=1 Tax=Fructobacillus americanaquae TaxID=2940302 RepID=A0ABY5C0Y3_9LACO|nr:YslB family protein [Fructobacillus americanaquae]USS92421.1 YslB family protein [Fructobacillus americanaquae]
MSNAHSQSNNGTNQTVSAFAPLLLRDALLANILTDDYANITYWAGKELARQFPVETSADLPAFFEKAAFGDLTIKYQSDDQQQWLLSGTMVEDRLATNHQADFSLETGFLAQQLELQEEVVAEGTFQVSARQQTVTVRILTDMSHKISSLTSSEQVALRDRFLDRSEEIATEDIDTAETITVDRQSTPDDEPAIQIGEVDQAASEAPVEVEPAASAASIQLKPTTSVAAVATDSVVSTAPIEITEPTSEPTDSQVANTLSVEQSITNSLLAFSQERRQKLSQKDDSSLN